MTDWWNSLPAFLRYLIFAWVILSLILLCYISFLFFEKILDKRIRNQQSSTQDQVQEVNPSVLKKIELRNTYKFYKIFRPRSVLFEQPTILKIRLEANDFPLQKGSIKPEFQYSWGNNRELGCGTASGAGPFKETEIPALNPHESSEIEMKIDMIHYIAKINNPASLTLHVYDSKGNRTGHKIVYFNLKSVEEAQEEVRGKVIFWAVLLTFFITLVTFSKNLVLPFLKSLLSAIKR